MSDALTFQLEIVTPERVILKTSASQVTLPTQNGEITILPHHLPLVSVLQAGVIEAKTGGGETLTEIMAVSGGFVEVLPNKVVILADTAEPAAELDETRIAAAHEQAAKLKMSVLAADHLQFVEVNARIAKELARARAVQRWKRLKNINQIQK